MPEGIPIDHVITLRNQGLSNDQIIQNLQRYGFGLDQINSAIMQADMKEGTIAPYPMYGPGGAHAPMHMPPPPGEGAGEGGDYGAMPEMMAEEPVEDKIHEIAEAIINEKWTELIDKVNKIVEWKDVVDSKISKMEQQMSDLSHSFDKLHEGVLVKIAEYDKGVANLGTDIKALEKVFQKILPGFVENVNELSRITSRVKKSMEK